MCRITTEERSKVTKYCNCNVYYLMAFSVEFQHSEADRWFLTTRCSRAGSFFSTSFLLSSPPIPFDSENDAYYRDSSRSSAMCSSGFEKRFPIMDIGDRLSSRKSLRSIRLRGTLILATGRINDPGTSCSNLRAKICSPARRIVSMQCEKLSCSFSALVNHLLLVAPDARPSYIS